MSAPLAAPQAVPAECGLLLLFTYRVTLEMWSENGMLDREVSYYRYLGEYLRDVSFLTYGAGDASYEDVIRPIAVYPRPAGYGPLRFSLTAPRTYGEAFRRANIIKSNQSEGAWTGVLAKRRYPDKLLVVRCGWVRTEEMMRVHERLSGLGLKWARWVERTSFQAADAVLVTTWADLEYVSTTYGLPRERIHVIANSVDTRLFLPDGGSSRDLRRGFRVISVARLEPFKKLDELIEAVRGVASCEELILVGSGPDRARLERMAAVGTVPVRFVGNVGNDSLPDLLRQADVFVLPQAYGAGMSKGIIEAMACGLVVVASDITAHRQTIADGVNGVLCDGSASGIRAALELLVHMSPDEVDRLRRRARQDVEEHYSMRGNARKEASLYGSLLAQVRG